MFALVALAQIVSVNLGSLTITALTHPLTPPPGAPNIQYYPESARSLGITGDVTLRCTLKESDKSLTNCRILTESPKGKGLGDGAIVFVQTYYHVSDNAIKAIALSGDRADGAQADIGIQFRIRDNTLPSAAVPEQSRQAGAAPYLPPVMLTKLDPDKLLAAYPAAANGQEGRAEIRCLVTVSGFAKNCRVVSETPPGLGFGNAALSLAPTFLYAPATTGGKPVEVQDTTTVVFKNPSRGSLGPGVATVSSSPIWVSAPSSTDLAAAFPRKSLTNLESATVILQCRVNKAFGQLDGCAVINVAPAGQGFEGAATKLTEKFHVSPQFIQHYKDELVVTFPIRFLNPEKSVWNDRSIGKINWTNTIDPTKVQALFPKEAAAKGVNTGTVLVDCTVQIGGALRDCAAVNETPPELGFAAAAKTIAEVFVLNPWTPEGLPVDGLHIRLPIKLVLDPNSKSGSNDLPAAKP